MMMPTMANGTRGDRRCIVKSAMLNDFELRCLRELSRMRGQVKREAVQRMAGTLGVSVGECRRRLAVLRRNLKREHLTIISRHRSHPRSPGVDLAVAGAAECKKRKWPNGRKG